jgi:tRNA threonylcarbamoyladenosine biosynthesis protein TsaE
MIELLLTSEQETLILGEWLARHCPPGIVVYLRGELGVGKTTLVRGFLRGLGYQGTVKSPTFTLVEPYDLGNGRRVYHFDLYRMVAPEELDYMGARDYFDGQATCLVEWPERGGDELPPADLIVALAYTGADASGPRQACLEVKSPCAQPCMTLGESAGRGSASPQDLSAQTRPSIGV